MSANPGQQGPAHPSHLVSCRPTCCSPSRPAGVLLPHPLPQSSVPVCSGLWTAALGFPRPLCSAPPPNPLRGLLRSNPHLPPTDPQRGAPSTWTSSNHVHPLHLSVADVFTVRLLRWTQWGLEPRAPRVQLCCTKMLKKSLVNERAN